MQLMRQIIFMAAVCAISGGVAQAAVPAGCGTLTAGYQVVMVPETLPGGSDSGSTIPMAVWYPSTAAASTYAYGSTISGLVALNGPTANCGGGHYPLIVFSHGYSGCGTQSVFLTEDLARQGYIVAAPDHQDAAVCSVTNTKNNNFSFQNFNPLKFLNPTNWDPSTGDYRNVDIETVLDWMLNNSPWAGAIDTSRIAMSGHSFGGYTAFAKVGGWTNPGGPLTGSTANWYDSRFTTALLLSPYIQPFQYRKVMQVPSVPQFYYGGLCDTAITPWITGGNNLFSGTGAYQQASFPAPSRNVTKYFAELDDPNHVGDTCLQDGPSNIASHFAFSNDICFTYQNPTTVQACLANVPNAADITYYSEAYFDAALNYGSGPHASLLSSTGGGALNGQGQLNTYWQTAAVPGGTYSPGDPAAPNSVAALKGINLSPITDVVQDGTLNMPTSLSGVTVLVNGLQAALYGVSSGQINFVVPSGVPAGCCATVQVLGPNNNLLASGPISVNAVSPAFFPILPGPDPTNLNLGWAWGWSDPAEQAVYNPLTGQANPVDVSQGNVYLELGGTGVRSSAGVLSATIGGVPVPVHPYSSPQYQAIDQVQIGPLPTTLAGKGQVNIVLSAGGIQSNAVAIVIK